MKVAAESNVMQDLPDTNLTLPLERRQVRESSTFNSRPTTLDAALVAELQVWVDNDAMDPTQRSRDIDICWNMLAGSAITASDASSSPLTVRSAGIDSDEQRYEPVKLLGAGGFGVVIQAQDRKLQRAIAVKLIRPSLADQPRLVQRFIREARAVASLQHPGIVQVYETSKIGDTPVIVGELVDGPSLASYMKRRAEPLPVRQAAWIIEQVALAVHYAHMRGILHRDLKPSNILLAPAPHSDTEGFGFRPRLTDFGLAKRFDVLDPDIEELSVETKILGTLRYMSPEQASGRLQDVATPSDIFTLGVILYQLLTGALPFRGSTDFETAEQISRAEPQRPRRLRPAIPRDLENIVFKCLRKNPEARYVSAGQLAQDLGKHLSGQPVFTDEPALLLRFLGWCRHYPRRAAMVFLMVASVLVAIVSTASAWWKERRASEEARQSLYALHDIVFPVVEKLHDGEAITMQDQLEMLSAVLNYHSRYVATHPQDQRALHRLSIAHYHVAHVNARLSRIAEANRHQELCLAILHRLLAMDPANHKLYRFQIVMSYFHLSDRRRRAGDEASHALGMQDLERAFAVLGPLVDTPDADPAHRDLFNALLLNLTARYPMRDPRFRETVQRMIDSSLALWNTHPESPLYAKYAIHGRIQLAELSAAEGQLDIALQHLGEARELFDCTLGPVPKEEWGKTIQGLIMQRTLALLLMSGRNDDAFAWSEKAREVVHATLDDAYSRRVVHINGIVLMLLLRETYLRLERGDDLQRMEQALSGLCAHLGAGHQALAEARAEVQAVVEPFEFCKE
jgi:serine/threonine protein kinase